MSSDGEGYPHITGKPPEPPDEVCGDDCPCWHRGECADMGWCDAYDECTREGEPCEI